MLFRSTLMTRRKGVLTVVLAEPIAFNDEDLEGITEPHDDVLVVTAWINGFIMKRVLVDLGSGAEVMYPSMIHL